MSGAGIQRLSKGKLTILLFLSLVLIPPLGLFGLKLGVESSARDKAFTLVSSSNLPNDDIDAVALHLTSLVHKAFRSSSRDGEFPLLMAMRPYLSHRFIPEFLRIHPGAIDTIYLEGYCDNAARALLYILNENGFDSVQLNIITPFSGHTAIVAEAPGGRRLLLDPDKGIIPVEDGKILSPEQAQASLRRDGKPGMTWRRLSPSSHYQFYENFAFNPFAPQGSKLEIKATILLSGGEMLQLGEEDGSSQDVSDDGGQAGISSYLHYIGSRYDRAWVRSLYFPQATRVTIMLTQAHRMNLITTKRHPVIAGKKLIYELRAGETLRFVDNKAGYNWLGLKSHQDIDYIRFDQIP